MTREATTELDRLAVVIDWLDACRARDLSALLHLYDREAVLHCGCGGTQTYRGRGELETYWKPRLAAAAPTAFRLDDIVPSGERVVLHYVSYEDKPVRMVFEFSAAGKIAQSRCGPMAIGEVA